MQDFLSQHLTPRNEKIGLMASFAAVSIIEYLVMLGRLMIQIHMAITSKFFADIIAASTTTYFIKYPVGFWLFQLMIFFVALMFEYKLYQNAPQAQVQPVQIMSLQNPSQPPIQYYAQPNAPYQPPNQQVIYQPMPPGQQQNSQPQ